MSLSADATLLTRGRAQRVIAAALLIDGILSGELDVELGYVIGSDLSPEPLDAWLEAHARHSARQKETA